jgi:CheY-like chemotaxis protein
MSHVLVVDDEPDSREFVARSLGKSGHRVTCAADGQDALSKLLISSPDAVVLDVRMPRMDGVSLLEVMRSYLRWHPVPVVVLSAHATPEQLAKMRELGVARVFRKAEFTLADLTQAVAQATGQDH